MKKLSFLLAIVAIVFIAGCKNQTTAATEPIVGPGISFTQPHSQMVTDHFPVTAPRYDCNGKILKHPKLLGMEPIETALPVQTYYIPDHIVRASGYEATGKVPVGPISYDPDNVVSSTNGQNVGGHDLVPMPSTPNSGGFFNSAGWGLFSEVMPYLFFIAFLILLCLLLYKIGRYLLKPSNGYPIAAQSIPPANNPNQVTLNRFTAKELQEYHVAVIDALGENGGGYTKVTRFGDFQIAASTQKNPNDSIIVGIIESKEKVAGEEAFETASNEDDQKTG